MQSFINASTKSCFLLLHPYANNFFVVLDTLKREEAIYGLPTLQLNTRANCCVYRRVHVAALFSKVISGTEGKKMQAGWTVKYS